MIFEDFVQRFDAGEVDESYIDQLVAIVYPEDAEGAAAHKARVVQDGKLVKFQAVGLNKRAQTAWNERRLEQAKNPIEPLPEVAEIPVPVEYENDIPDEVYDHPDYVPEIKSRVGIVQAVRTWGKPQAKINDNRTEGIMVRCPYSHHVDNVPSVWCNSQKNTWTCGKCGVGGDVIVFYAARKYDMDQSDMHGPDFARIAREMADELGILIVSAADGSYTVEADTDSWASNQLDQPVPDEPELPPETATVIEQTDEGPLTVEMLVPGTLPPSEEASEPITLSEDDVMRGLAIEPELPEDEEEKDLPSYEWRDLGLPEDTFMYAWMENCTREMPSIPEEFFIGLGFQAIGMAMDHNVTATTHKGRLTGQTLCTYIANSAVGKSEAVNRVRSLLRRTAAYDSSTADGVKIIKNCASAEDLIQRVQTVVPDPGDPKATIDLPTNSWLNVDELATFMGKANRGGASVVMKTTAMELHDFVKENYNIMEESVDGGSRTHGALLAKDTYFSATFTTQPQSLKRIAEISDMEMGFLNRMQFFAGPQRHEDDASNAIPRDPHPEYIALYARMLDTCDTRNERTYTQEALELVQHHPLKARLHQLAQSSPMYGRYRVQVYRFAMFLAVNENSVEIEARHINAAYKFVAGYITPCAALVADAVQEQERDAVGIVVDKMEEWVGKQFDKKGEWPEFRNAKATRWWKNANAGDQNKAVWLAGQNGTVVRVTLIEGPWGSGKRTVAVLPTGDYAPYEDGKTYKYVDFYAGRSKR